jgi:hypothetical protein
MVNLKVRMKTKTKSISFRWIEFKKRDFLCELPVDASSKSVQVGRIEFFTRQGEAGAEGIFITIPSSNNGN